MTSPSFSPFKLTFHLRMPIVMANPWVNFDSILTYLEARAYLGRDFYLLPTNRPLLRRELFRGNPPPPLLYESNGLIHASVSQFDVPRDKVRLVTLYKRIDEATLHFIDTDIRRINVGSGFFRAYMMNLPVLPASKVSFYINGDIEKILELTQHLVGVGKKCDVGFGDIKSVSVEETPEDYSLVKEGVAMRQLPVKLGYQGSVLMWLPSQPPYWSKRCEPCVAPGAKVYGK